MAYRPASAQALMVAFKAVKAPSMRSDWAFFRLGLLPWGSLSLRVWGETGIRMLLNPNALISAASLARVRPLSFQNMLPMYISIGAPLGFSASEGSCLPSRPNQDPPLIRKMEPLRVMLPLESTAHTFGV